MTDSVNGRRQNVDPYRFHGVGQEWSFLYNFRDYLKFTLTIPMGHSDITSYVRTGREVDTYQPSSLFDVDGFRLSI